MYKRQHAERITNEALNGNLILVDGDSGVVHLRPEDTVTRSFRDKVAMQAKAMQRYASLRDLSATTTDGVTIGMLLNCLLYTSRCV